MVQERPRILVTGTTGQVGAKLALHLRQYGEIITASRDGRDADVAMDLCDEASMVDVLRSVKAAIIVNPAAYTAVDKAEDEPELATQINAKAPALIAREAHRSGATLIHYSTDYVYAGVGDEPVTESCEVAPPNTYGRSKAAGDAAIRATAERHVILRTSWVFSDTGKNFVRTMLRLGTERKTLRVVADQIGAPTSADFIARMTAEVVRRCLEPGTGAIYGTYHLTCAGAASWHQFADEIFRQARGLGAELLVERVEPIESSEYPTPAPRPKNSRLDTSKFVRTFGPSMRAWQDALAPVLASLLAHDRKH